MRRFPPPWSLEDNGACFIVRDNAGQALSYVYYEEEPGRRAASNLLNRDEARRIATNIAKLSDLLRTVITAACAIWSQSKVPASQPSISRHF